MMFFGTILTQKMTFKYFCCIFLFAIVDLSNAASSSTRDELTTPTNDYVQILGKLNQALAQIYGNSSKATDDSITWKIREKHFRKQAYEKIKHLNIQEIQDNYLKRQLELYSQIGIRILPESIIETLETNEEKIMKILYKVFQQFQSELSNMISISGISQQEIADNDKAIEDRWIHRSINLAYNVEPFIKNHFVRIREAAALLHYNNPADLWMYVKNYELDFSEDEILNSWNNLTNSYHQFIMFIHLYLQDMHYFPDPDNGIPGPLPAFLYDVISYHFSSSAGYDLEALERVAGSNIQKRNGIKDITREAEKFFESLGFTKLEKSFWEKSKFSSKSEEFDVAQYVTSDTYYWIINAPVSHETFCYLHLHMFKLIRQILVDRSNIPAIFKKQDHEPFYVALDAAVAMSAKSYRRAIKLKFIKTAHKTTDMIMNNLMAEAASTFTKLASSVSVDSWKWDMLRGKVNDSQMLKELWNRRLLYERVVPTIQTETAGDENKIVDSFTYYHFPDQLTYKNFTAIVLQYQIFGKLCEMAGQYDPSQPHNFPLYDCDIFGQVKIGELLKDLIQEGASKPWREQLFKLTGKRELDVKPLIDYFAPLYKFNPRMEKISAPSKKSKIKNIRKNFASLFRKPKHE